MLLDETQINALKPEDRRRYMALEQLFAQPGWKIVVTLAKENAAAQVQRAAFAENWAANRLAVGNGAAWNEIARLEENTEAAYAAKLAEVQQAKEIQILADESDYE